MKHKVLLILAIVILVAPIGWRLAHSRTLTETKIVSMLINVWRNGPGLMGFTGYVQLTTGDDNNNALRRDQVDIVAKMQPADQYAMAVCFDKLERAVYTYEGIPYPTPTPVPTATPLPTETPAPTETPGA